MGVSLRNLMARMGHDNERAARSAAPPSTWPRPAPSPTCPAPARWSRSGRSRPPPRRWPRAARCLLTWSSAAAARCMPSPRAPGPAAPGVAHAARHRRLVKATGDGTFTAVTDHLDRPTSLEFIGTPPTLSPSAGDLEDQRRRRPPCGAARQATTDPEAAVGALDKGQIGEVIALACTQTRSKCLFLNPGEAVPGAGL